MTHAAIWLLAAGVCLFIGVLVSQGVTAVLATLALAGWGLIAVALFHLLPLVLDAAAIRVLLARGARRAPMVDALLARWVGESVSSLMPAGQIGGPLLMIRQLSQRGTPAPDAAAAITVSTTFQTFAQIVFALMGVAQMGVRARSLFIVCAADTPVLDGSCVLGRDGYVLGIGGATLWVLGSLVVQEAVILLLAPLSSLRPDVALALSLAKRARELLLASPGLVCLHVSEQALRRRVSRAPAV